MLLCLCRKEDCVSVEECFESSGFELSKMTSRVEDFLNDLPSQVSRCLDEKLDE